MKAKSTQERIVYTTLVLKLAMKCAVKGESSKPRRDDGVYSNLIGDREFGNEIFKN